MKNSFAKIFVAIGSSLASFRGLRSGVLLSGRFVETKFLKRSTSLKIVSANKASTSKTSVSTKKIVTKAPVPAAPAPPAARARQVGAASASSVLGRPLAKFNTGSGPLWTPVDRVKAEWKKFYQNLLDLHSRLREQMSGLAKESQTEMENYSLHMGDSGTDNFDRDFALSLLSSDQDAIYEIEEALKRIEKDTYGVCELTSKPIPKARLEAIPWTRFTVEAQAQLEKDGALRQRRLGALGSVDSGAGSDSEDSDDEPDEKPAAKDKD
jgi:RNA polymerase-binding transcription factor DksA